MLYLVPTPIGNLKDITLRALEVLKQSDFIICEDTRRTGQMLKHYEIPDKKLMSFHEHSGSGRLAEMVRLLEEGKTLSLVSDGGTPLISDPGFQLARECIKRNIPFESLPGPCALITALAASGLATDSFCFFGFLPQKSAARRNFLKTIEGREETLIFYESPFRLVQALKDLAEVLGDREAAVARELTKKFEEISRGRLSELIQKYASKKVLGEIVILVSGKGRKELYH